MITAERTPSTTREKTGLQRRLQDGRRILLAELSPPLGGDPAPVRQAAKALSGKVHAVAVSDNREHVAMAALAAAALVTGEGLEAVLHVTTRDRNRAALVSECLGAQALGVRNLLCTTGSHQTLAAFRAARNVFDVDSIQLLQTYAGLETDAALVGEAGIAGAGPFCLGATASPYADPLELQMVRLSKKIRAGAEFVVTDPVHDLERFTAWWNEVTRRGLHERVAIVASVRPLTSAEEAQSLAGKHPTPRIPEALVSRLRSQSAAAQRAEGIQAACETIERLSALKGLRGFAVMGEKDPTLALEVLEKSALKP